MSSANVTISELDLSTVVPSYPGLYIGMVLPNSEKGKPLERRLITNETQFLTQYTYNDSVKVGADVANFSALSALSNTNKLWVVPAENANAKYAFAKFQAPGGSNSSGTVGLDDPEAEDISSDSFMVCASSPKAWGNNLRIAVFNYKALESFTADATANTLTVAQNWGTGFPVRITTTGTLPAPLATSRTYFVVNVDGTTIKLAETQQNAKDNVTVELSDTGTGTHSIRPAINYTTQEDTFLIQVFDKDNLNDPLEQSVCSKVEGTRDGFGRNIYLEDAFLSSTYIDVYDNVLESQTKVQDQVIPIALGGGETGIASTDANCVVALDELKNSESVPITLLIDGGRTTVNYHRALIDVAEERKDCLSILSVPFELQDSNDYSTAIVDYRTISLNANSSRATLYAGHVKIFDKFNNRQIYVAPDGFMAGLISRTAADTEMWYPVAGFRRGILNVLDVRRRFTKGEMDYLYDNDINPIRFAQGRGIVAWGQKNLLGRESTLNRNNVRLLLISISYTVKIALEDFLFEINDEDTRLEVTSLLNAAMDTYVTRRGISSDYTVICNSINNNGSEPHKLYVKIVIKPSQSVEEIPVTIVIPRNSSDFSVVFNGETL